VDVELRVELGAIAADGGGVARVPLHFTVPHAMDAGVLRRVIAGEYADELARRLSVKRRRFAWGSGLRVDKSDGELGIELRGLDMAQEARLPAAAREAQEHVNRDLGPDGESGVRVRKILTELGPEAEDSKDASPSSP
jgi:hypothetical protein